VSSFKQLAIIGPTASGKSALAIDIAKRHDGVIFSIDSLAVYKKMDIVSAKPSLSEQEGIKHFGIDILDVTQEFSAQKVTLLYEEAKAYALQHQKNLIVVGGSSFYLKSLLTGLSVLPEFSKKTIAKTEQTLKDLPSAHAYLKKLDPLSVENISENDPYRLEKLFLIHYETGMSPSEYFKAHPPLETIQDLSIFEILVSRDVLRERVKKRTNIMIKSGLIDEIADLEFVYGRSWRPMKAIGVIETLQYLDNKCDLSELEDLITTHTMQLAKRQSTFNRTQFQNVVRLELDQLPDEIDNVFT